MARYYFTRGYMQDKLNVGVLERSPLVGDALTMFAFDGYIWMFPKIVVPPNHPF